MGNQSDTTQPPAPNQNNAGAAEPTTAAPKSAAAYPITDIELEVLAEYWAKESAQVRDTLEYFCQSGSSEMYRDQCAYYRLSILDGFLGVERVEQILEEANEHRFMSRYYEAAGKLEQNAENPQTPPEAKVLYTDRGHCIVFHHSRAGLRANGAPAEGWLKGWCWQTATDFKAGNPLPRSSHETAEAALKDAQAWEDNYLKTEQERIRRCDVLSDNKRKRQKAETCHEHTP